MSIWGWHLYLGLIYNGLSYYLQSSDKSAVRIWNAHVIMKFSARLAAIQECGHLHYQYRILPHRGIHAFFKKNSKGHCQIKLLRYFILYIYIYIRDGAITLLMSNFNKLLITITNFYWNDNEECMLFGNDMRLKLSCLKDPSNGLVMGTDDNSIKE